jgi:hypothetical protein
VEPTEEDKTNVGYQAALPVEEITEFPADFGARKLSRGNIINLFKYYNYYLIINQNIDMNININININI